MQTLKGSCTTLRSHWRYKRIKVEEYSREEVWKIWREQLSTVRTTHSPKGRGKDAALLPSNTVLFPSNTVLLPSNAALLPPLWSAETTLRVVTGKACQVVSKVWKKQWTKISHLRDLMASPLQCDQLVSNGQSKVEATLLGQPYPPQLYASKDSWMFSMDHKWPQWQISQTGACWKLGLRASGNEREAITG